MAVTCDTEHKFELCVQLGDYRTAYNLAKEMQVGSRCNEHFPDKVNSAELPPFYQTGLVVKASASRAEDPGFESRLRWDFSGAKSYQWLKNWHSSGYPARRLAL